MRKLFRISSAKCFLHLWLVFDAGSDNVAQRGASAGGDGGVEKYKTRLNFLAKLLRKRASKKHERTAPAKNNNGANA